MHLIDRTDLFKINNLVLGGKTIVTCLYSCLEGQRERERECVQGFIPVNRTALLK